MATNQGGQSDGSSQSASGQQAAGAGQTTSSAPPSKPQGFMKKLNAVVERTVLDLDACRDVVSRLVTESESKVAFKASPDEIKPIKPIEKFKIAAPCDSAWSSMIGTNRCRFCSQCNLNVYDCSGIDMVEIEQTIFQKENKSDFVLYKRKDGRFLTANCPVGQKRVQAGFLTITFIAAGVTAVIGLFVWLGMNRSSSSSSQITQSPFSIGAKESSISSVARSIKVASPTNPAHTDNTPDQAVPSAIQTVTSHINVNGIPKEIPAYPELGYFDPKYSQGTGEEAPPSIQAPLPAASPIPSVPAPAAVPESSTQAAPDNPPAPVPAAGQTGSATPDTNQSGQPAPNAAGTPSPYVQYYGSKH